MHRGRANFEFVNHGLNVLKEGSRYELIFHHLEADYPACAKSPNVGSETPSQCRMPPATDPDVARRPGHREITGLATLNPSMLVELFRAPTYLHTLEPMWI